MRNPLTKMQIYFISSIKEKDKEGRYTWVECNYYEWRTARTLKQLGIIDHSFLDKPSKKINNGSFEAIYLGDEIFNNVINHLK